MHVDWPLAHAKDPGTSAETQSHVWRDENTVTEGGMKTEPPKDMKRAE